VLTTVGSREKAERTRELGADIAVNYREQDFVAEVQKATGGRGANVIIENVAADNLAKDFGAIALNGRIVVIGSGTGKPAEAPFPVFGALFKDVSVIGMSLVNAGPVIQEMAVAVMQLFAAGSIRAIISRKYPLAAASEALEDLVAGKVIGKLVLCP
jgi:NADPH:quinone reductase-like Zn-dependent oxidoreductase